MATTVSQFLQDPANISLFAATNPTVTSALASDPSKTVQEVATRLFGAHHHAKHHTVEEDSGDKSSSSNVISGLLDKLHVKSNKGEANEEPHSSPRNTGVGLSQDDLDRVASLGQWGGIRPSDLFLNMYARAIATLETNPLNGLVSPAFMGGLGVVPLTIISVIPDIIQHHADLIVRVEREIFLATNYWENSSAAETIVDAIRELSRRVVERKGPKVVIKLMYDRGNPKQVISPHQAVDEETYTGDKVNLPHPDSIPGCDLQVQNYHLPPVGTFHSKFMVVDRKIGILNSNNIQDRVNVEMMAHYEGPIVQSLYDMALLSWWTALNPPLPLLTSPPTYSPQPSQSQYDFGTQHPLIDGKGDLDNAAAQSRQVLRAHHRDTENRDEGEREEIWDQTDQAEATRMNSRFGTESAINQHLNTGTAIASNETSPPPGSAPFSPFILHTAHDPFPMALVNRCPRGRPGHSDTFVPQDQAWLAGFEFAKRNVFIQTPTFNAKPIVAAALAAVRRGILVEIYADLGFNDEGELLPYQGGTNEMVASEMYGQLKEQEKSNLKIYWYTGKDQRTPLNAKDKSRNCHVKLMIVDKEVGMQGNGNQDSQSWYHSQEINMLLSSALIAKEWRAAIDANQNTRYYGLVDPADGVWRDPNGKELPGQKKPPSGPLKSLVGVKGAIQRVRGEGGF